MNQPLSYIHPQADIADNVVIEPFVSISKNVTVEEGTWIGPNVSIMEGARIGKNCKIFPGAVISAMPQDLKYNGEDSTVEIGNNVTVRECVTINRGTQYNNKTSVGDDCLLMAYVHIAHDCVIGNSAILANNVNLAGHINIGDFVVLGGMTAIHQFVQVGAHAYVSGGSLVRKDVPPYVKAGREPLSYVGVNSVGLRRSGYANDKINHILDIYRTLFVNNANISKGLGLVEAKVPATKERDEIISFIRGSVRGVMKGFYQRHDN